MTREVVTDGIALGSAVDLSPPGQAGRRSAVKQSAADEIGDALHELRCISEVMVALGENAVGEDGMLPATWVIWLGSCLSNSTEKISDAMDEMKNAEKHKESAKIV